MANYCLDTDIVLGDVEVPRYVSVSNFATRAAEDMDAKIGQRYKIPLNLNPGMPGDRADILLLKSINIMLATGRLILAGSAGGEFDSTHAYGTWLVKQAEAELCKLADGTTPLRSQALLNERPGDAQGPIIVNTSDDHSLVGEFYGAGRPKDHLDDFSRLDYPYGGVRG